jgi:hypothetical protein
MLQRKQIEAKRNKTISHIMKVKAARNTRFADIDRMQRSLLLNRPVIKSIIWDSARGERTPFFKSLIVKGKNEEKSKKMLDIILSNTSMKQIELHQKFLGPIGVYTRQQDSDAVSIHRSAIRWYTVRVKVAKELTFS